MKNTYKLTGVSKLQKSGLTLSRKKPLLRSTRPKRAMKKFQRPVHVLDPQVNQCVFGHYPWDDWERDARAAGVSEDLAGLGRLVVREAHQHNWNDELKALCGWYDQGRRMIKLALGSPKEAHRQWNLLLRTDGLRGDYLPRSTQWTWGYLGRDAQRLCQTLFGS